MLCHQTISSNFSIIRCGGIYYAPRKHNTIAYYNNMLVAICNVLETPVLLGAQPLPKPVRDFCYHWQVGNQVINFTEWNNHWFSFTTMHLEMLSVRLFKALCAELLQQFHNDHSISPTTASINCYSHYILEGKQSYFLCWDEYNVSAMILFKWVWISMLST